MQFLKSLRRRLYIFTLEGSGQIAVFAVLLSGFGAQSYRELEAPWQFPELQVSLSLSVMESSLRGHAAYQQQQQQQQQQEYRRGSSSQRSNHGQQQYQQHQQHQQQQDLMSVGSHYSRGSHGSASHHSSVVDDAYRRLGRRLSLRAHGDQPMSRPQRSSRIGLTSRSGFSQYDHSSAQKDGGDLDGEVDVSIAGLGVS